MRLAVLGAVYLLADMAPALGQSEPNDLYEKELHVGSLGAGTVATAYPRALAALLGLKFKLVGGYAGSSQIYLAMERGEVEAICEGIDGVIAKRPTWIPEKIITLLVQGGAAPNPDLKDVPLSSITPRIPTTGWRWSSSTRRKASAARSSPRLTFHPQSKRCYAMHSIALCASPSLATMRRSSASIRGGERRLSRRTDEVDGGDAEADQG
jgi:hypothetical protein